MIPNVSGHIIHGPTRRSWIAVKSVGQPDGNAQIPFLNTHEDKGGDGLQLQ